MVSVRRDAVKRGLSVIGRLLVALLGVCVIAATLIPVSRSGVWWVRAFDFPRLQVLALAVLAAVTTAALPDIRRRTRLVGILVLVACGVAQSIEIVPYTPLWPDRSQSGSAEKPRRVAMLIANVKMKNRQSERLLATVYDSDPEIIIVVEPDRWWQDELRQLETGWPYIIAEPRENTYGLLIYSRLPLHSPRVRHLVEPDVPSAEAQVELPSGARFDLHVLHPKPPSPAESKDTDERDAELLIVGDRVAKRGRPAVVAGDLNDVAWSRTTNLFLEISGLLDPRVGRGLLSSYHAEHWFLRWPLDHVFHSEDFLLAAMRRLPPIGSDHFPILVELALTPEAAKLQEAPQADRKQRKRAREKIEEAAAASR